MDEFKKFIINHLRADYQINTAQDRQLANITDEQVKTIANIFGIDEGEEVIEDELKTMLESHEVSYYEDAYEFLEEWIWVYLGLPDYLEDDALNKIVDLADEGADEMFDNISDWASNSMEIIELGYKENRSFITVSY